MIAAYLCDALSEAGLCAVPDQPSGFTLLIVDRTLDLHACLLHDVTYQVGLSEHVSMPAPVPVPELYAKCG